MTVEANPETVTPELARALRDAGVTRVSLGAQTFRPRLLSVLERVAQPDDVRRAVHHLRDAGFDNISLDLIYGIPGQSASDLEADLDDALALEPEHLSCYELEAKPGTRFTHAWGAELARQADAMEDYFERVVAAADGLRLPLVRDGELLPRGRGWAGPPRTAQPRLLARPRLPRARDRRGQHNRESALAQHAAARALPGGARRGTPPEREVEPLDAGVRARERVMLGLRLDEPLPLGGLRSALDADGLARAEQLGLAVDGGETLALTRRGRFLGGGVTAEIVA